ncbi:bifunctional Alba-like domain superfamily/DNA-RNA-binding protein Alba-like [Babesia duncani]|uniref:Bifunctional Alba-like domain superfamily/DNA-RNA-binding protein Alba-like n=1 Tax=Babesia duncani TaxID=323732 RepID=A0AAD9PKB2_9APIC|nr:bifunctional Alba-like domain superfamily/DNA-RNA-binding protein Alba-like [Babesia duncani]
MIESKENEGASPASGEIRVTTMGRVASYVAYAKRLLESGIATITIRGTGRAMSNVVETAEVLKYTIKGLHQVTAIDTVDSTGNGETNKDQRRNVCFLIITLTKDPSCIDTGAPGYQAPVDNQQGINVESLLQALKIAASGKRYAAAKSKNDKLGTLKNSSRAQKAQ